MAQRIALIAGALALAFHVPSDAQGVAVAINPSQQISALAPQLQAFAGSQSNFDNLAAALVQGTPATLQTTTADGVTQIVTIAPQAPLTPADAARTLEASRQLLIARGISTPTAEQIGISLVGGALPTALGTFRTNGVLSGSVNPAALTVQRTANALSSFGGSAQNFQSLTTGLTQGRAITLNAVAPTGIGQAATFTVPGAPLSQVEANQALQLASQLLSAQGIVNPTPQQIQVALLGGTLINAAGGSVPVQGVLQNRAATAAGTIAGSTTASPAIAPGFTSASPFIGNTSDTPIPRTSDSPIPAGATSVSPTITPPITAVPGTSVSPVTATSTSPVTGTSVSPGFGTGVSSTIVPGAAAGPNGAPSPAAQMQGRR